MTLRERYHEALSKMPPAYEPLPESTVSSGLAIGKRPTTIEYECWKHETFQLVEVTPPIEHPDIADKALIRRFMDLPKFLDLITNRRLILPRISELKKTDPYECNARRDYGQILRPELEKLVISLEEFAPEHLRNINSSRYLPHFTEASF